MIKYLFYSIFILLSIELFSQSNDTSSYIFPKSIGVVNDFENDFTSVQKEELTLKIARHQKSTTNQIVIVSVNDYGTYNTLFWYSLDMFNTWGIGEPYVNNGVLLIFSLNKREIRIQVGYGLEKKLEDHEAKYIIDQIIIPKIKENQVYDGILLGLEAIIVEIE